MKTQTTPKKLLSQRAFERKVDALRQKHIWLLKDKPLEIRPGWIELLDDTLTKMKRILTEDDIDHSHLEFLYCSPECRMHVYVDVTKLSDRRIKVIDHLIDHAMHASEHICPKCGCDIDWRNISRPNTGCLAHRDFEGDFAKDYRQHLKVKKHEEEAESERQQEAAAEETQAVTENEPSVEIAVEDAEGGVPRLRLYAIEDVHKLKQSILKRSADADCRNRLKAICDDMIKRGEYRPYCCLPELESFSELGRRFPNFQETIEAFRNAVALANLGGGRLEIPPLLLVGPPGIGKTQLANELAGLFETDCLEIKMEAEQTGATITGSSEFWSNTQTGQLFNVLTTGRTANPIVLLDELDKAGGDSRFNPVGGLYGLLERETARRFEDQSIRGFKIDASAVIWMITANDKTLIPEPILSRVVVQHIRPPTKEESIVIASSIYGSIMKERPWGKHFITKLSSDVAEKLSMMEPRQMKVSLLNAFGKAAIASRDFISPDDIPGVQTSNGRIGFV